MVNNTLLIKGFQFQNHDEAGAIATNLCLARNDSCEFDGFSTKSAPIIYSPGNFPDYILLVLFI